MTPLLFKAPTAHPLEALPKEIEFKLAVVELDTRLQSVPSHFIIAPLSPTAHASDVLTGVMWFRFWLVGLVTLAGPCCAEAKGTLMRSANNSAKNIFLVEKSIVSPDLLADSLINKNL
jgi:hypothetical protein